jgi:hypothetical protein
MRRKAMEEVEGDSKPTAIMRRIAKGEVLTGPQWAKVVSLAGDTPLPENVRAELVKFLEAAKSGLTRRGRKPEPSTFIVEMSRIVLLAQYKAILDRFRDRRDRKSKSARRRRKVSRVRAPPQELALRWLKIHCEQLQGVNPRTLANRISRYWSEVQSQ